jgi:hypothetical protein
MNGARATMRENRWKDGELLIELWRPVQFQRNWVGHPTVVTEAAGATKDLR